MSSCHGQCSPSVAYRVSIDRHYEPLVSVNAYERSSIVPLFFARKNNSAPFARDDSTNIAYAAI